MVDKKNKKFKAVFVRGEDAIEWTDSLSAMESTYLTEDGKLEPFPLVFDANPYNEDIKNAKKVFELGCGVGRNLPWIMENTDADYYCIEPNKSMSKYFWIFNDEKYKDRVHIYSDWPQLEGAAFDVMLSTFVLQHITYRVKPDLWNVSDIVDEMQFHSHKDTVWVMYEHESEMIGWQKKMFEECNIVPDIYIDNFVEIESQTHRDYGNNQLSLDKKYWLNKETNSWYKVPEGVKIRQGHSLIIWKGRGGQQ